MSFDNKCVVFQTHIPPHDVQGDIPAQDRKKIVNLSRKSSFHLCFQKSMTFLNPFFESKEIWIFTKLYSGTRDRSTNRP